MQSPRAVAQGRHGRKGPCGVTSAEHTQTPGTRLEGMCPSHLCLGQLRAAGTARERASFVVVSVLKRLYSRLLVLDLPSSSVMSHCCISQTKPTGGWNSGSWWPRTRTGGVRGQPLHAPRRQLLPRGDSHWSLSPPLSSARCAPRHPSVLCFSGETHTIRGVFSWPKFTMANGKSDTGLRRTSDAGSPHRLGQLSHAPWRGRPCQPVHLYMTTAAIGGKNEFCIFKHSVSRSPMVGDPRLS